jgi:hypothetical protein
MPKYELTKTIEARKLNPRTEIPTSDPLVTIPFGAIISDAVVDRDVRKFSYLGLRYQCPDEVFRVAAVAIRKSQPAQPGEAAVEPVPGKPAPEPPAVSWERLTSDNWKGLMRTRVPGGWLVALADDSSALAFYADPDHRWR